MDDETHEIQKASSIKPPMIKPPMVMSAQPPPPSPMTSTLPPVASPARSQASRDGESSNKLVMVVNFILLAALLVGLAILAYRWLR